MVLTSVVEGERTTGRVYAAATRVVLSVPFGRFLCAAHEGMRGGTGPVSLQYSSAVPLFDRYGVSGHALLVMRTRQVQHLLEDTQRQEKPVLLIGDWNTKEVSDIHQAVRRHFRDRWAEAGRGSGWMWPHNLELHSKLGARPVLRLDHTFAHRIWK